MSNEGIFNNGIQMPVQLQKVNEPVNWQHYRIKAAIAAMQAHLSRGEIMAEICKKHNYDDNAITKFIAEGSVMYADALIAELQKKQD